METELLAAAVGAILGGGITFLLAKKERTNSDLRAALAAYHHFLLAEGSVQKALLDARFAAENSHAMRGTSEFIDACERAMSSLRDSSVVLGTIETDPVRSDLVAGLVGLAEKRRDLFRDEDQWKPALAERDRTLANLRRQIDYLRKKAPKLPAARP